MTTHYLNKRNRFGRFVLTRKAVIVDAIAALFILLFLYTALSKSTNINSTELVLKKTPLFSEYAHEVAWGVVVIEYVIALLLFIPRTRKTGLYSSLILMACFTAYIVYMKAFVSDLPCSCGGVISKLNWNEHLVFNISFSILAFAGILLIPQKSTHTTEENIPVVFT